MGLMYSITVQNEAIAAAGDMLELLAPADAAVKIHSIWVEQHTEAGDAQSEQVSVTLSRVTGAPTSGQGGTAITPRALTQGAPAAGTTVEANNTTDLSGGTSVDLLHRSFNVMVGLERVWTPAEAIEISPSTRALLKLAVAGADSIDFDYGMIIEEIGG